MRTMRKSSSRRRGAGMTEYVIIVGMVGILLVGAVERFKDQIYVTIVGSSQAMQDGMGPQYWPDPSKSPGTPTSHVWDKKKGGDGKNYRWNGTAWVPA